MKGYKSRAPSDGSVRPKAKKRLKGKGLSDADARSRTDARALQKYVDEISARKYAEEALQAAHHGLERRVEERTAELQRINVLLTQEIEERKRAEEDVANELRFEAVIAEISSKFVNLPSGEVDREIVEAQRRIFELLDLDVSGFWRWSAEASGLFRITHFSRPGEGAQIPEQMSSQEYFPWYQQQVMAGRTVAVSSMEELPPEAARDRETFRQYGFKSNLTIPLSVGGEPPIGALGFNTTRAEREWPDMLVKRLQLVGQIFASALARKNADQALRESEERMTLAASAARLGLWTWDLARDEIWATDKSRRLLAFDQLERIDFDEFMVSLHPEDREPVSHAIAKSLNGDGDYECEYRVVLPGRPVRWIAVRGGVQFNSAGKPVFMHGVSLDITERKRTEDALRASELKYRNLVEMTGTGYLIIDVQGRVLDANQEYVRISGHRELREIAGRSVIEWTAERAKQLNAEAVAQCAKDGFIRNLVTEYADASGRSTFVEVNATVEGEGESARIVSLCRDITERKEAQEKLAALQRQHERILDSVAEGILGLDLQGNHLFVNPAAARMLGYEAEELLGRHSHGMWRHTRADGSPYPEEECKIYASYRDGNVHRESAEVFWRKDGTSFPVEYVSTPIYEQGRLLGAVVTFQDITARRRAEQELTQQRNELAHLSRVTTVSELSGSLAHELNQPLGIILSNAQAAQELLLQEPPLVTDVSEILSDIIAADRRAADIIVRLRGLLKRGEASLQPLALNDLIEEMLHLVRADLIGRGVIVACDLALDLPPVIGDRVQLQQLALNLILNAADAVAANPPGTRRLYLTTTRHQHTVRTSVRDEGSGLPADVEQLFQPFFTTKIHGLGMGLPICRTIITAHHGRLWGEPHPERGAVFHFELPVEESAGDSNQ